MSTAFEEFAKRRSSLQWRWPNGALLAFSVELCCEAFDRHSQYRIQTISKDKTDHFSLSFADYGWRVGVWRLLALLEEYQLKSHVLVSGLLAEQHPDVVAALVSHGHEISGHGWVNDLLLTDLDRDQERELIRRCTVSLTKAAGAPPRGWTSAALMRTKHTPDLVRAEGYQWFGDDASDDLPFIRQTESGPLVFVPRNSAFQNDLSIWITPRGSPETVWDGFKNSFDTLYAEARMGLVNKTELTLHCHLAGRPTLIPIVRRCLDYVRKHEGIWFARRGEIVDWTLQLHQGGQLAQPSAAD